MLRTFLQDAGLVLMDSGENGLQNECSHMNGDINDRRSESLNDESGSESGISGSASNTNTKLPPATSLITREAAKLLAGIQGNTLECKLKNLFLEKKLLIDEVSQLKLDLEDEKQKSTKLEEFSVVHGSNQSLNISEAKLVDAQSKTTMIFIKLQWLICFYLGESNKLISDYKYKLKKAEQDISSLQSSVSRLESQLARCKTSAEESEKIEDELKADKRKLQREVIKNSVNLISSNTCICVLFILVERSSSQNWRTGNVKCSFAKENR